MVDASSSYYGILADHLLQVQVELNELARQMADCLATEQGLGDFHEFDAENVKNLRQSGLGSSQSSNLLSDSVGYHTCSEGEQVEGERNNVSCRINLNFVIVFFMLTMLSSFI